jgi:hypothetical protein
MTLSVHIAFNAAALLQKNSKAQYFYPILFGAIVPDITMILFFIWNGLILKLPSRVLWDTLYFQPKWAIWFDIPHSFIVVGILLGLAYYYKKPWWIYFFGSMALHSVLDFPVHQEDAHAHFWPFSYRFSSPISYYRHGFQYVELIIFVLSSLYVYKKLPDTKLKYVWLSFSIIWTLFIVFGLLIFSSRSR